jgi:formylglycine-generating enzyme required for sulfatase activity
MSLLACEHGATRAPEASTAAPASAASAAPEAIAAPAPSEAIAPPPSASAPLASPPSDDAGPAGRGFWLDTPEVTNAAYGECVAAGACARNDGHIASRSHAGDDAEFTRPTQPVVGVTWDDGVAYCKWRGKRLPREAEFEKAVRDNDGRRYAWGSQPPTPELTAFGRALGGGRGHGTRSARGPTGTTTWPATCGSG